MQLTLVVTLRATCNSSFFQCQQLMDVLLNSVNKFRSFRVERGRRMGRVGGGGGAKGPSPPPMGGG